MALRSLPPTHLPLIFSAPSSASFCHLSSSVLAAARSGSLGFSSMNFCHIVTAAMGLVTDCVLSLVAAKLAPPAAGMVGVPVPVASGVGRPALVTEVTVEASTVRVDPSADLIQYLSPCFMATPSMTVPSSKVILSARVLKGKKEIATANAIRDTIFCPLSTC